jgi:hypothetical protein
VIKGSVGKGSPGTHLSNFCWHASPSCGAYHTSRQGIRLLSDGSLTDSSRYSRRETGITKVMTPFLRDICCYPFMSDDWLVFTCCVVVVLAGDGCLRRRACGARAERALTAPSSGSVRQLSLYSSCLSVAGLILLLCFPHHLRPRFAIA